ncbi:MAG TPA: PASTA domain-containing protein [Gaiellaceae bacterium]
MRTFVITVALALALAGCGSQRATNDSDRATPRRVRVPQMVGLKVREALGRIGRSGLCLGTIKPPPISSKPGRVVDQQPSVGALVAPSSSVTLRATLPRGQQLGVRQPRACAQ